MNAYFLLIWQETMGMDLHKWWRYGFPCEIFLITSAKFCDGRHGSHQTTVSLSCLENKERMQRGGIMDVHRNFKNLRKKKRGTKSPKELDNLREIKKKSQGEQKAKERK